MLDGVVVKRCKPVSIKEASRGTSLFFVSFHISDMIFSLLADSLPNLVIHDQIIVKNLLSIVAILHIHKTKA